MPIYEYRCQNCGEIFEEFQLMDANTENMVCPRCGTPKPERILSSFSSTGKISNAVSHSGSCSPRSPFM